MNKKSILLIAVAVLGVIALGIGGFIGFRMFNRSQAGFPGGPRRGFGNQFLVDGERTFGELVSISDNSLTIINQEGEQVSINVGEDTQFFSQDSSLNGLQDLEVGQEVSIFYEIQADGSFLALNIGDFLRLDGNRNIQEHDNN